MAKHIADEHGGSSIGNVTVTNALSNKLDIVWQQLKSKSIGMAGSLHCIPPLRSMPTEAKLFLLICSIFSDDFRITIEDLVAFGMSLELFEDVFDMYTAKSRVHTIISIINGKSYSRKVTGGKIRLAHEKDGPHNEYVEMLDGARDLAKSIASSYPLEFHREIVIGKWPESNWSKDCYGLSLVLKKVNEYPINWDCPKLALLQLQYKEDSQSTGIDIFDGMKELRVLSLDVPSLPQSLKVFRNLRTLRLRVPKCEDMSWIGGMTNLKFLLISISQLTDIPMEMGKLENLMLLDLRKMNIAYIPQGVLSRLLKLEELYLPLSFNRWGCKAKKYDEYAEWELGEGDNYDDDVSEIADGERINASLTEVVSHSLNALQISVPKASVLPKKSQVFKNIREFKILMPNNVTYKPFGQPSTNELQLTGEACDIKESGICGLIGRTEDLSLIKVRNLKNVICQLQDIGFPQLKKMIISECDELEYVVDITRNQVLLEDDHSFTKLECLHLSMLSNLKEICDERWSNFRWFPNLSQISIRFCPKLKYVFPLSIVRGSNLKSIEILDCHEMEGIFYEDEEESIPDTVGSSIEKLDLHSVPRLVSLLVHKDNKVDGICNDMNKHLTTNKTVSNYSEGSISTFVGDSESSLTKLEKGVTQQVNYGKQVSAVKNKDVISHMKMHSSFPPRLVGKWFQNLKILKIAFCNVKIVFLFEAKHATSKAFNCLEVLELYGLQNLVHIWFQIPLRIAAFKNLQLLVLSRCCNLYLFSSRVARLLVQLQKVYISRCEKMKEIIVTDDERNEKIVLPRLKLIELQYMCNLRFFSGGTYEIELPLLESLKFNQCNQMKSFSYGLLRTPKLGGVEINESLYLLTEDLNETIKRVTNPEGLKNLEWLTYLGRFTFDDLEISTNSFSSLLGEGGFGRVYKGWIDKRTSARSRTSIRVPVAVKSMNPDHKQVYLDREQGLLIRKLEVNFLGRLSHVNVVKLLGHCFEKEAFLLVFEFVERGSLDKHLFITNPGIKPLSWDMRINIAIGVARGLDFLHTSTPQVIHRDIKSSHILLDSDYNAKISHFDMVRLVPSTGESHVSTPSFGYTDPIDDPRGHLHVKSDVYSFGVVLLELMTGLRVIDSNRPKGQRHLLAWLNSIFPKERELKNMMDSRMEGQYSSRAMLVIANLVSECTQDDYERRPTMREVLEELELMYEIKD